MTKSIIYYTDSIPNPVSEKVRAQLLTIGLPIVSVSLQPISGFGNNIVLPLQRSIPTMFRQQLTALENSEADIIFFCEHDVLYHPSHFEFIPPRRDIAYYNVNVWKIRYEDGLALWVNNCIQVSGLCAYREDLLTHYRARVALAESVPVWDKNWGYEPGTPGKTVFQGLINSETWMSPFPILDIRHNKNLTKNRWSPTLFRNKRHCQGWTEKNVKELPGWKDLDLYA